MISVIVPIYNCEKQLDKCIRSIINQTYKDLEIILINDGSTDNSYKKCIEYEKIDKRIKVISNSNHGVSYSRNQGISIAKGDYITFVDADDYIEEDTYEKILSRFNNKLDFIRYNIKNIKEKKFDNLFELKNKTINIQDNKKELFRHFFTKNDNIPCFSVLLVIKNNIAKKISFNENLSILEDADFYLQLFQTAQKGLFLDLKKYHYYINPKSAMHNEKYYERNIFSILKANYTIIKKIKNENNEEIIKEINSTHLDKIVNFIFKIYYNNEKQCIKIIKKLKTNKQFLKLSIFSKNITIKNKILIFLIRSNSKILIYIYLKIIKLLKKIK